MLSTESFMDPTVRNYGAAGNVSCSSSSFPRGKLYISRPRQFISGCLRNVYEAHLTEQ